VEQCKGKLDRQPPLEELKQVLFKHKAWCKNFADMHTKEEAANLCGANLSRDTLLISGATLECATLCGVDLSGVNLENTNLRKADLGRADLNQALFEPKAIPQSDKIHDIASAQNLELMIYDKSPEALVKLRKAFKDAGFYEQERKITCAIKHSETMNLFEGKWHLRRIEAVFNYVFFDLTTRWGVEPGRALLILLTLIPAFAIPYVIALQHLYVNGIWRKWSDDRIRTDLGTKEPVLLRACWRQALWLGLYFSVLSAFNIGWRELNVGNWIQRIQANEYTLTATGWVRTVSGVQSLISVYLLAIWVLTYFGRPFE
jgi:hypothetical protein